MNKQVTVIIPTYNRSLLIAGAISSIEQQTISPSQIIVVDDGSDDGTDEVVKRFPQVEYHRKLNGGKSSALNLGLTYARGEFIWIFDDDDIAERRALERMLGALDDPSRGFAYGGYVRFKGPQAPSEGISEGQIEEPYKDHSVNVFGLAKALMFDNFVMQPGLLVRKSCYDAVGPFNEDFVRSQDYEMMLRLAMRFDGVRVPYQCFYQRQHDGLRGTKALQVKADQMMASWQSFDKKLFSNIYQTKPLSFFGERHSEGATLTTEQTISAQIARGSIMAKKHLWDLATLDLRETFERSRAAGKSELTIYEREAFRQIFAFNNLNPGAVRSEKAFLSLISNISNTSLRRQVQSALLYPAPYVIRSKIENRSYKELGEALHAYLKLGSVSAFYAVVQQRIEDKRVKPNSVTTKATCAPLAKLDGL